MPISVNQKHVVVRQSQREMRVSLKAGIDPRFETLAAVSRPRDDRMVPKICRAHECYDIAFRRNVQRRLIERSLAVIGYRAPVFPAEAAVI